MKEKQKISSGNQITFLIISFFLAALLVFTSVLVVTQISFFNDREILTKVSQTTYLSQLNEDVTRSCHSIAAKYGVDYGVVSKVITPSRIETDMSVYFNSISSENPEAAESTIDTKRIEENLYSSFVNDKNNPIEPAVAEKAASLIATSYKETLILEHLESFYKFADDQDAIINYVFWFLAITLVVLAYLLIYKNTSRKKHRLLRKFSVVFSSAGFTIIVLSMIVKFSEILEKIAFYSSEREYNIFMKIFDDCVNSFTFVGAMYVVLGALLMALWYYTVVAGKRDSLFK